MSESKKNTSIFEALGPGKTFGAGFVFALLVFCTIGFFVMLGGGLSMGDKSSDKPLFGNAPSDNTGTAANQPTNTGQDQDAATAQIAAITAADHVRGDLQTAQAVIVEYSDFDCPFCTSFHNTMQQIMADYDGQVAWVYRHFPLDSLHPGARPKAEASECIAALGDNEAFWAFADAMFDDSRTIATADLPDVAAEVGVDQTAFENCFNDGTYSNDVQADYQDAVASGGRGTPYSVIVTRDGTQTPISGALPAAQVKALLDPLLQ